MNDVEKKELNELLQGLIQIKSVNPPGNENRIANFIRYKRGIIGDRENYYIISTNIPRRLIGII